MLTLLASALLLLAQDGGKIEWRGKGAPTVQAAYEDALKDGRPIMLYFNSEGNEDCKKLSDGAFSDPAVVDMSRKITCIFIECAGGKRNEEMVKQLQVTKYPTIAFLDGEGRILGQIPSRDAAGLAQSLHDLADRGALLPRWPEDVDGSIREARRTSQPLILYFYDDSPACLTLNRSFLDSELKPLRNKFVFARFPMKKGSETCVKFDVDHAPSILVLNPTLKEPESKPLLRINNSRSPRELRRDLEDVLSSYGSNPAATPAPSSLPLPSTPAPKTELSNDELDRKFIQARIDAARRMIEQKKIKEAIDVLDDVVKSYPKHVATVEAAKLLELLKK